LSRSKPFLVTALQDTKEVIPDASFASIGCNYAVRC